MTQDIIDYPKFVSLVIEALHAAGIEYMVGGALALWAWGEPRATMDNESYLLTKHLFRL